MEQYVVRTVERAFPGRTVRDVSSLDSFPGSDTRTVRVEFADEHPAYVKIVPEGSGSRIRRERALMAFVVRHSDVPVPTVLAVESDAEYPFLATESIPDRTLDEIWSDGDDGDRESVMFEVGRALADLHAIRLPEHGHVVGVHDDRLQIRPDPWPDVLLDRIERIRTVSPGERFEDHFDEVTAAVERNRDLLQDVPAALLHGDPARSNCFRVDGTVGFLDWESAHVGDPVRELCRAERQILGTEYLEGNSHLAESLLDGYRELAGSLPTAFDQRRPLYEAVTFLGVSGYFERWAPELEQPAEDLAELVQDEMDRRLAEL